MRDSDPASENSMMATAPSRLLADSIPQIVFTAGPDGVPDWFNQRWFDYTGLPTGSAHSMLWQSTIHPEDLPVLQQAISARHASDPTETIDASLRLLAVDGGYRWHLLRARPELDRTGRATKWYGTLTDIDRLKRTELAPQQGQEVLDLIASTAPVMLAYVDRDLRYRFVNRAYEKFFGRHRSEIIGNRVSDLVGASSYEQIGPLLQRAIADAQPQRLSVQVTSADGRAHFLESNYLPDVDEAGLARGAVIAGIDMTEVKRAEAEARNSRDQLQAIFKNVGDGITVLDAQGRFVFANETAAIHCGFDSVEALLACPQQEILEAYELFDENHAPISIEQLPSRQAFAGVSHPAPMILKTVEKKTDRERWSKLKSTPILDEQGRARFVVTVASDYSEQKRIQDLNSFIAEAASLLGSSIDYEKTLANLTTIAVPKISDWCSVHVFDATGRLQELAVAHKDPEKIKWARELGRRYPPDIEAPYGHGLVLRTGQSVLMATVSEETLLSAAKSEEHLAIMREIGFTSYLCVALKSNGKILGSITFVTAESRRKLGQIEVRMAEELAARAALAIENARLYSSSLAVNRVKDEFLATLSHELRTPLNVIQGHAELIKMDADDLPPDLVASADAIYRNAKLQTEIINDLLDISAIITGKFSVKPQLMDPAQPVRAALESVRFSASAKGITVIEDFEDAPSQIWADTTRLQQIVWNLLTNAVKFTPRGGRVKIASRVDDSRFVLEVEDNGIGIEPEFLARVFERFRQEDSTVARRFGGLGLGLSIVRHLVEMHGGTVMVSSEGKGLGTRFTVVLPIAAAAETEDETVLQTRHEVAAPVTKPAVQPLVGVRILLVEDQADGRALIEAILHRAGADVAAFASAREAFAHWQSAGADAIVSDIGMPEEDGYAFIRRIRDAEREKDAFVPALALTAYARDEEKKRSLSAGFQAHVAKPVPAKVLVDAVVRLLHLETGEAENATEALSEKAAARILGP